MFQEFPKCLVCDEESLIVFSQEEEDAARQEGWKFHSDPDEEEPKKRGRPRKVQE